MSVKKKRTEDFDISSTEKLESLLASSTWRPGRARPPASLRREAWIKTKGNSWVKSMITMGGGIGFGYVFKPNTTLENLVLAIGTGVVVSVVIFLIFWGALFVKELYGVYG